MIFEINSSISPCHLFRETFFSFMCEIYIKKILALYFSALLTFFFTIFSLFVHGSLKNWMQENLLLDIHRMANLTSDRIWEKRKWQRLFFYLICPILFMQINLMITFSKAFYAVFLIKKFFDLTTINTFLSK